MKVFTCSVILLLITVLLLTGSWSLIISCHMTKHKIIVSCRQCWGSWRYDFIGAMIEEALYILHMSTLALFLFKQFCKWKVSNSLSLPAVPFDLLLFPPILMSSSILLNHPFDHTKALFLLNFYSNSLHSVYVISIVFMWTNHPDHFYSVFWILMSSIKLVRNSNSSYVSLNNSQVCHIISKLELDFALLCFARAHVMMFFWFVIILSTLHIYILQCFGILFTSFLL